MNIIVIKIKNIYLKCYKDFRFKKEKWYKDFNSKDISNTIILTCLRIICADWPINSCVLVTPTALILSLIKSVSSPL